MLSPLRRSGFTLVEMLITITIFSILMSSVFIIYRESVFANRSLDATRALQVASRDITDRIAKDIRDYGLEVIAAPGSTPYRITIGETQLRTTNLIRYYLGHDTPANTFQLCDPERTLPPPDTDCRLVRVEGTQSEYITSPDVALDRLRFDIIPTQASEGITAGRE